MALSEYVCRWKPRWSSTCSLLWRFILTWTQMFEISILTPLRKKSIPLTVVAGKGAFNSCSRHVKNYLRFRIAILVTTLFERLLFLYAFRVVISSSPCKDCRTAQVYATRALIGFYIHLMPKAWRQLLQKAGLQRISTTIAPYLWYDESKAQPMFLLFRCGLRDSCEYCKLRHCMVSGLHRCKYKS